METRRDVFQGIADPTRREIIRLVAQRPQNVNALADKFEVTRQAVSLHVKILTECGLIVIKKQGRERLCEAKLDGLDEVTNWIAYSRSFWKDKFDSLDKFLAKTQITKKTKK